MGLMKGQEPGMSLLLFAEAERERRCRMLVLPLDTYGALILGMGALSYGNML